MGAHDAPAFDLQSHSTRSDGALEPSAVVAAAAAAGVALLALTDHDTVDGVGEALAAGADLGVRVVPAVELSTVDPAGEDLHVLGYGIDHTSPALLDVLADLRSDRAARADAMAQALEDTGLLLDRSPLEARRAAGLPIGRPHLAKSAFDHPGNAARIAAEGLADFGRLLEAYLIPGAPAFVRRTRPSVADAIALIHEHGGVAIWAHPFWDVASDREVLGILDRFVALGLDGVEAFYVTHTAEQTVLLADAAAQRGLLTTGSADFHGPAHPRFSAFRAFGLHGRQATLGPINAA